MWLRIGAVLTASLVAYGDAAGAQGPETDGALFLLLPVGAQSVGMGQATVAGEGGSEAVWSNPAGVARQDQREAAIHHSETIAAVGDVITFVLPRKHVGAVALSLNLLDFGDQQITDVDGTPIGLVLPRNLLLAATFGLALGTQLSVGATYKRLQYRVDCSGQCANVATFSAGSSAADVGVQYAVSGDMPVRLGAAVRNIGSGLNVNEQGGADPLPTRVEVGASYPLGFLKRFVSDVEATVAVDVLGTTSADEPSARFGADLTYQKNVHLRAGYIVNDANGTRAGVGFGLAAGRLLFDIARTFGGLSEGAGKTPTYVSLRYMF